MKILSLALCLMLAGCAKTYSVSIAPTSNQKIKMVDGLQIVQSIQKTSIVAVLPPSKPIEKRATVVVVATNAGSQPFNFGTENINANSDSGTLHVYSYAELMEEEENRQTWAAIGNA
jgi:hypothetical protein